MAAWRIEKKYRNMCINSSKCQQQAINGSGGISHGD